MKGRKEGTFRGGHLAGAHEREVWHLEGRKDGKGRKEGRRKGRKEKKEEMNERKEAMK